MKAMPGTNLPSFVTLAVNFRKPTFLPNRSTDWMVTWLTVSSADMDAAQSVNLGDAIAAANCAGVMPGAATTGTVAPLMVTSTGSGRPGMSASLRRPKPTAAHRSASDPGPSVTSMPLKAGTA